MFVSLAGPVVAEDPAQSALRAALNPLAPIPEETSRAAQSSAAELLGRYLIKQGGNHFCQQKIMAPETWVEMKGFIIQRMIAEHVTPADKANGIQEKLLVFVDCEMHRTRKPGEASWSQWINGRLPMFPAGIYVEHAKGKWTASSSSLQHFNPIGVQQAAASPARDGLPPGMTRIGPRTSRPPAKSVPLTPVPTAPKNSTAPPAQNPNSN